MSTDVNSVPETRDVIYPVVKSGSHGNVLKNIHKVMDHSGMLLANFKWDGIGDDTPPIVYYDLASDFGDFKKEHVEALDFETQALAVVTEKELLTKVDNKASRKFETLTQILNEGLLRRLRVSGDDVKSLYIENTNLETKAVDATKLDEVKTFLKDLVLNEDEVFNALEFDKYAASIANMYSQSRNIKSLLFDDSIHYKFLDLTVIRFPDIKKPFVYIYHVNINIGNQTKVVNYVTLHEKNYLYGKFQYKKFALVENLKINDHVRKAIETDVEHFYTPQKP